MFDAVALHAYWSSAGFTLDNALRYRRFAAPGIPRFLTEIGRDQVADGPNGTLLPRKCDNCGYIGQGLDGDSYLRELSAFDAELRKDNVFATVFTTSADSTWTGMGFSVDDLAHQCNFTNIGPHDLLGNNPAALEWASRAPIVKSVDNTAAIHHARQDAIVIYRARLSPVEQSAILYSGLGATTLRRIILNGLDGFRHPNLYVELLNEVNKNDRVRYANLARDTIALLHAQGIKVCGPGWASGDFEQQDWDTFVGGGTMLYGVDIANVNGAISILDLDPRPDFVIAKVSQDAMFVDRDFARHREAARSLGIGFGGYHFGVIDFQPDPVKSCDFYLSTRGAQNEGEIGALDIETYTENGTDYNQQADQFDWVYGWGQQHIKRTGYKAKLYCSVWWLANKGLNRPEIADTFDYWYPNWSSGDMWPAPPPPFKSFRLLQYNADGIDKNRWSGTLDDFKATGKKMDQPTVADTQLRDQCYALAGSIQATADQWRALGYPQTAQLCEQLMEGFRTALVIGKGEK